MGKTVAFIPVRGGSKSIPLKNIKEINGRPLVYWTIDAAINCKYIDEVIISTDSEEIRHCIQQYDKNDYNKLKYIDRNPQNATDTASTESVLLEFANQAEFENVILIQATSPLLEWYQLDEACEHFFKNDYDSLLSLVRQKRFIWRETDSGIVNPINYNPESRPRRQEFDGYLVENGAFYITTLKALLTSKTRISGNIGYYEMPEETYFEIDEPEDWLIVEQLLRKKQSISLDKRLQKIKLFATDCDGVLTDAGMYYSSEGDTLKKFNTKDGMGLSLLKKAEVIVAILTGEDSPIVKKRAEKLNISHVYLGCDDKVRAMEELLEKYNLSFDQVAYVGDDLNDIPLLKKVGVAFSVADATAEVKQIVDYVTTREGGQGAVREIADILLPYQP
ncbi:HAD-IIIA family hydrolase [Bacillus sp. Hm123]|uniref:HAD-IIIA family hydrolase n=1 Tax=Bacillus sp. Hm123 TaxID=3450745 RepID=UPI003F4276E9